MSQPLLLALETSCPLLSVALQRGEEPVREITVPGSLNHVENLMPAIDQLVNEAGISLRDIGVFLMDRGPGSFTGLRVGFAALKAFRQVQKKDCYGALSLDMIAENIILEEGAGLAVCLDAHRGKIYLKEYERVKGKWEPRSETRVGFPTEILASLSKGIHVAGNALSRYPNEFGEGKASRDFDLLPEAVGYPKASTLIRLFTGSDPIGVRPRYQKLVTPADFVPLYFRLSEAEEKNAKHGSLR